MNRRARSHLLLLLVAMLAVAGTVAWQRWTLAPIDTAQRQQQEQQWLAVLPADRYDNQPLRSPLPLVEPQLRHSRLLSSFQARLDGTPSAILLRVECQGYAGPIELAVAIDPQGRLLGIQVLRQQESPGLGDQLAEPTHHWLAQFSGKARSDTPDPAWALKRDHGEFDQLAGATVTSRAVIDALQDALRYFDEHRLQLLGQAPHE